MFFQNFAMPARMMAVQRDVDKPGGSHRPSAAVPFFDSHLPFRVYIGGAMNDEPKQYLRTVIQVALGVLFVYSGGMKLFVYGLDAFLKDVGNFKIVEAPLDMLVAYSLPWLELIAGICLMIDVLRRGAVVCAIGMTLVFIAAIGSGWWRGLDLHCGCFGNSTEAVNYPVKMALLVLQLLACLAVWFLSGKPRYAGQS
jgi:uncharacterized membrane protein YphA (DoxX/SURF4 family)